MIINIDSRLLINYTVKEYSGDWVYGDFYFIADGASVGWASAHHAASVRTCNLTNYSINHKMTNDHRDRVKGDCYFSTVNLPNYQSD